jgi:hypothetical protein
MVKINVIKKVKKPKEVKPMKQNKILNCYKNDGTICDLDTCDYFQLELIGNHAETKQSVMLLSKCDLNIALDFCWYLGKSGYPITHGSNKDKSLTFGVGKKVHTFLYKYSGIYVEKGNVIDHINHDRLDNRRDNLRVCTQKENSYNTSRRNGKFKGIKKCKDSWTASITKDGVKHEIKDIKTEEEAAKIYDMMAENLFGEYAGKNYFE